MLGQGLFIGSVGWEFGSVPDSIVILLTQCFLRWRNDRCRCPSLPLKADNLFLRFLTFASVVAVGLSNVDAWSPMGHHVTGVIAYELLNESDQAAVIELLTHVPDFEKNFAAPTGVNNQGSIDRWRIGVAGAWPDIIRGTDLDRPSWHYQLGANLVIGMVEVPDTPGPLPSDATLETQSLHIQQALELCTAVFSDASRPKEDRAIALCWMLHLYADGHQPCHAGSLYAPEFLRGDRGANFLKLKDGSNLHAAWDGLLGRGATVNDVRRRVVEMGDVKNEMLKESRASGDRDKWLASDTWLAESTQLARSTVYTDEVLGPVIAASRGLTRGVPPLALSKDYYRSAGMAAKHRVKQAGFRVALAIHRGLLKHKLDDAKK